jgi:hypothetical protein
VPQYARYRAPAESGQVLAHPPWDQLQELVRTDHASWRRSSGIAILGQPLAEYSQAARRELIEQAAQYVGSYHAGAIKPAELDLEGAPLIVTGHQPELVHPGVWVKNFAAAALARCSGGVALNLVINGDACRSTTLRVPGGTLEAPRFSLVQYDAAGEAVPWEERGIVDRDLWRSFAERVRRETEHVLPERMLDQWWTIAIERGETTGKIGLSLAQARHLTELRWGQQNLELPQSDMCATAAFRRFACHVMQELPRFIEAYNGALADYRRAHGIRNRAHPVSNLAIRDGWLQTPFWAWTEASPNRRSVYVRSSGTGFEISDLKSFDKKLPLGEPSSASAEDAVELIGQWEREGLKLRSRALVTTMFARLAIADLFIHGIGGAKYDEATDDICARFFGQAPPPFATISGTLRLPAARTGLEAGGLVRLEQRRRELTYHPERFLPVEGTAASMDGYAPLVAEKHRWVATVKTPLNAAERHRAIVHANAALQPFVASERARVEQLLTETAERRRADRILNSREYAFCLFPREMLREFLLDFPCGMR